ncbi:hypothetical protein LTR37_010399 [Vermiconidia calcicola]|uniref:Uncharacterized protein n=1 Tax=Vermiconidia calcicola TaxID=1690605 RepID=A0ACC3N572_9PEZI|nr:hypothetical protein LTR37_010399 [Vermiconidia calcicola]
MGRQQYLERLALGRSPFEELPEITEQEDANRATSPALQTQAGQQHEQQYDAKGRPFNPSTEERKQATRNAQNAVLALVGVVESKNESAQLDETKQRQARKAQENILRRENERGEEIELMEKFLHGLYSSSRSFADIVLREFGAAGQGGLRSWIAVLLPGLPARLVCALAETLLYGMVAEVMNRGSIELTKRTRKTKQARRIDKGMNIVCEVLFIAIDVALLPLKYHGLAQSLGLAPAWPLLPSWRSFMRTDPTSIHHYIWHPAIDIPLLRFFASPAALMLMWTYLTRNQDEEYPIGNQLTNFKYPAVTEPIHADPPKHLQRDPLGWILHHGARLRAKTLNWLGWKIAKIPPYIPRASKPLQCNYLPQNAVDRGSRFAGADQISAIYRSTSLAMHPAKYLGERIDNFLSRLISMSFETMVLRAIASSYLTTPLPKTPLAIGLLRNYYSGEGVLSFGRGLASWHDAGSYASKLGFSLALHTSIEIGIFFALYRIVRWQGTRFFYWGNLRQVDLPDNEAEQEVKS